MAVGIVVTFLPLAVARTSAGVAALALLAQPATAIGGRWLAGRYGDRRGPAVLLAPGVLVAAAGMLTLSLTAVPAAVIAGAAVFGAGFGVTQNASLTLMYDRVPESGYSAASALWNLAYDGGMGVGAAGFGVLAAHTGYPAAFALTAAVLPAVLPAARPVTGPVISPVISPVIGTARGRRPGCEPVHRDRAPRPVRYECPATVPAPLSWSAQHRPVPSEDWNAHEP